MMGRFTESEAEFEVARNLDPASAIIATDLAQLYNFEKKYQRSLEVLDEALKLDPAFHLAHYRKGYALMLMRRPAEALKEFEAAANGQAGVRKVGIAERAWVAAVAGKREQAIELGRRCEREKPDLFLLSVVWTELGDTAHAMDFVQAMYERRTGGVVSLKMNPVFEGLRGDERFRAALKRMNL